MTQISTQPSKDTRVANSLVQGNRERRAIEPSPEPKKRFPLLPEGTTSVETQNLPKVESILNGASEASPPSLEFFNKNNCNNYCGKYTVAGPGIDGNTIYSRLYCKTWGCPRCGPKKALRLRRAIARVAMERGLTRMATLTLDPKTTPSGIDEIAYIRETWRKFRVYLKRKYGVTISYIQILEFHHSGLPHLHVLIDRYVPQAWISRNWKALGGGQICDIRKIHDAHRIAHYLAKYLTKGVILSAPVGVRRYSNSRDIRLSERSQVTGWVFLSCPFDILRQILDRFVAEERHDHDGWLCSFTIREVNLEFSTTNES